MKYGAQERAWVRRILVRLTPAERAEYQRQCAASGNLHRHRNGKLYDQGRAEIAERILLERYQ